MSANEPIEHLWAAYWYYVRWGRTLAQANAIAESYLADLVASGCTSAPINSGGTVEVSYASWAAGKIREAGLKVTLILRNMSARICSAGAGDMQVYHTGYVYNAGTYPWAYCPGYRGTRYDTALTQIAAWVAATEPDVVMADEELWQPPGEVEERLPGEIAACTRCGDNAAFEANHRQAYAAWVAAVGGAPVYFYGANWYDPCDTGRGNCPIFYYVRTPAYHADDPDNEWAGLEEVLAEGEYADTDRYAWELSQNHDAFPWVTHFTTETAWGAYEPDEDDDDGQVYHTPAWFERACILMARAGASGFSMYPNPVATWTKYNGDPINVAYANYSEYWQEKRREHLRVGIAAFAREQFSTPSGPGGGIGTSPVWLGRAQALGQGRRMR